MTGPRKCLDRPAVMGRGQEACEGTQDSTHAARLLLGWLCMCVPVASAVGLGRRPKGTEGGRRTRK
jgi:hypothetical protein